jgi:hypothetical protein
MVGLLSPDELPKMILERQYFIDYRTSHRLDSARLLVVWLYRQI